MVCDGSRRRVIALVDILPTTFIASWSLVCVNSSQFAYDYLWDGFVRDVYVVWSIFSPRAFRCIICCAVEGSCLRYLLPTGGVVHVQESLCFVTQISIAKAFRKRRHADTTRMRQRNIAKESGSRFPLGRRDGEVRKRWKWCNGAHKGIYEVMSRLIGPDVCWQDGLCRC
jgi:hypothetical protein